MKYRIERDSKGWWWVLNPSGFALHVDDSWDGAMRWVDTYTGRIRGLVKGRLG